VELVVKTTETTRREFLKTSALAVAALPVSLGAAATGRYPIGFSTLGCPAWDWIKILDFAQQQGFAAVV
jgi:anaerobic selenocysteine-containing dehydrogenase